MQKDISMHLILLLLWGQFPTVILFEKFSSKERRIGKRKFSFSEQIGGFDG